MFCIISDLNFSSNVGSKYTVDQIVNICRPILQLRRAQTIEELGEHMKKRFPRWFASDTETGRSDQLVRRLVWVYERLGKPAADYLKEEVRKVYGKGAFSDKVICDVLALLPPVKEREKADEWRVLNEASQLLLYQRINQTSKSIPRKDLEKARRASIGYYFLQKEIEKVINCLFIQYDRNSYCGI